MSLGRVFFNGKQEMSLMDALAKAASFPNVTHLLVRANQSTRMVTESEWNEMVAEKQDTSRLVPVGDMIEGLEDYKTRLQHRGLFL